MRRAALQGAALAVLLVLTACAQPPGVGPRQPEETSTTGPTVAARSAQDAAKLAALKKAAGIAECPPSDPVVTPVPKGLPDVVLACLGGGRDVRLAGLRGRPLLVNVWAQWCGPCRDEAPYLAEVAAENTTDLLVLGVDYVDPQPDLALEFADLSGQTYPQVADTDKALAGPLQLIGPPITLFVRADGTIAYRHSGPFRSTGEIRTLARERLGLRL